MKLEIIGTNSAFAKNGPTTSIMVWDDDGKGILLDCGAPIFQHLLSLGYADKIKAVLLSHTHQDHCGSAVTLAEYAFQVLGRPLTIGGVKWDKLLKLCDGDDYPEKVRPFDGSFCLESWEVPHAKGMECRALLVGGKVLFSGDTAISLLNTPQAEKAQIIIHGAHLKGTPNLVAIAKLGDAPAEIRAKTWLIHYLPADYEKMAETAKKYGLAGVAKPGMVFELK